MKKILSIALIFAMMFAMFSPNLVYAQDAIEDLNEVKLEVDKRTALVKLDTRTHNVGNVQAMQLSFKIERTNDDKVQKASFEFSDTLNANVKKYRYNEETGVLTLYMSSKKAFLGRNSVLGKIVFEAEAEASVNVSYIQESYKSVRGNAEQWDNITLDSDATVSVYLGDLADKTELKKLIDFANGCTSDDYTSASVNKLRSVVDSVQNVVTDLDASETQVEEATQKVQNAIGELKLLDYALTIDSRNGKIMVVSDVDDEEISNLAKIAKGTKVKIVPTPNAGYKFAGIVDEEGNTVGTTFELSKNTKLTANFVEATDFTVKVIDGEDTKTQNYKSRAVASVSAKSAMGEQFAYWIKVDEEGKEEIVSYQSLYTFIVTNNITLKAVYSEKLPELKPVTSMDSNVEMELINGKYRLSFTGKLTVPEGYTVKEFGMLYTPVANPSATDFIYNTSAITPFQTLKATNKNSQGQYVVNVNNTSPNVTRSGRMYMICVDSKNKSQVIYSDTIVTVRTGDGK